MWLRPTNTVMDTAATSTMIAMTTATTIMDTADTGTTIMTATRFADGIAITTVIFPLG